MSGYKRATVTISEQEYRRLHEADMKRRFRERKKATVQEAGMSAELTSLLQQMENRQRHLEQALESLDQNFNQIDTDAVQDILTQNALAYERLAAMVEEEASHSDESMARLSQLLAERMEQQRDEHHHNLQALAHRLDASQFEAQVKEESARQWLDRAIALADFIEREFDHERFLPGRLSRILPIVDFAQNNLAQGFQEASLQNSQQAFLQLSELDLELEQRVAEWHTEYGRVYQAIRQFISDLELNSKVSAFGLQGEELADQVDLAYWTNGKYQQLLENCRNLLEVLVQDQQRISTEELRRTYLELLPAAAANLESLIYEARLNALNSQLRMNIAETALLAFEVHGFALSESGYVNDDMRAPFTAHLASEDGIQVSINVLPKEQTNQGLENELEVVTRHPDIPTEQTARMHWQEVCLSLREYNLNVSRPEIRDATIPSVPDYDQQVPAVDQPLIRSER